METTTPMVINGRALLSMALLSVVIIIIVYFLSASAHHISKAAQIAQDVHKMYSQYGRPRVKHEVSREKEGKDV